MNKTQQALLSFGIRVIAISAVAAINFISSAFTNGTLQLPVPTVVIPFIGLLISEADTWLVNWNNTINPTK